MLLVRQSFVVRLCAEDALSVSRLALVGETLCDTKEAVKRPAVVVLPVLWGQFIDNFTDIRYANPLINNSSYLETRHAIHPFLLYRYLSLNQADLGLRHSAAINLST